MDWKKKKKKRKEKGSELKMQSGKNVKGSVKETAANVAASAKSGMDKTKATVQEKVLFHVFYFNHVFCVSFYEFIIHSPFVFVFPTKKKKRWRR